MAQIVLVDAEQTLPEYGTLMHAGSKVLSEKVLTLVIEHPSTLNAEYSALTQAGLYVLSVH